MVTERPTRKLVKCAVLQLKGFQSIRNEEQSHPYIAYISFTVNGIMLNCSLKLLILDHSPKCHKRPSWCSLRNAAIRVISSCIQDAVTLGTRYILHPQGCKTLFSRTLSSCVMQPLLLASRAIHEEEEGPHHTQGPECPQGPHITRSGSCKT